MDAILQLPTVLPKAPKKPKPKYVKPESLKALESMYFYWYYAEKDDGKYRCIPEGSRVRQTFRDDTTNALTKAIKAWFSCQNGYVARVNTTGMYDGRLKRYRHSGATHGVADLVGTFKGKSVSVEVKFGRDKQSERQEKYQRQVEAAGGVYIIARSFDGFLSEINNKFQLWALAY